MKEGNPKTKPASALEAAADNMADKIGQYFFHPVQGHAEEMAAAQKRYLDTRAIGQRMNESKQRHSNNPPLRTYLVPCPFCGAQPSIVKLFPWFVGYDARCLRCKVTPTQTRVCHNWEDAVEVWNSRFNSCE